MFIRWKPLSAKWWKNNVSHHLNTVGEQYIVLNTRNKNLTSNQADFRKYYSQSLIWCCKKYEIKFHFLFHWQYSIFLPSIYIIGSSREWKIYCCVSDRHYHFIGSNQTLMSGFLYAKNCWVNIKWIWKRPLKYCYNFYYLFSLLFVILCCITHINDSRQCSEQHLLIFECLKICWLKKFRTTFTELYQQYAQYLRI